MVSRCPNGRTLPNTFTHLPTRFIYPSNIEFVPKGGLIEIIRRRDKYLKGRVVKVLSTKIRILLEDGCIKITQCTSIRIIDPDHLLGDSIPLTPITLGHTDNITRR